MVKSIIFDYGGVLGSDASIYKRTPETNFQTVLNLAGISRQEAKELWLEHWHLIRRGEEKVDVFWQAFMKRVKNSVSRDEVEEAYEKSISLSERMLEFAKVLKVNYQLFILANESKEWMRFKMERFHLEDIFKKVYCSAFLGMAKPEPAIFHYVLKDARLLSSEALLIDNFEDNIEAAEKLGIKGILFSGLEQLKKDLIKAGIVW